jgi:hypothetical protein
MEILQIFSLRRSFYRLSFVIILNFREDYHAKAIFVGKLCNFNYLLQQLAHHYHVLQHRKAMAKVDAKLEQCRENFTGY